MKAQWIQRENRGATAILTLNNAARRNALSRALVDQLADALAQIDGEPQTRVVILTGDGSVFCSGMDLKETRADPDDSEAIADAQRLADLFDSIHGLGKPTIAALNGDAYAGGAGLAMSCDFAIAAEGVKIGYPEVKRGLVASIVMHDLIRLVGERRARGLLLTGEAIEAEQALDWGLLTAIAPASQLLEQAEALAARLAENGPNALRITKKLIDEATRRPQDLRGAAAVTAAVRVSDEAREGVAAFLEKRSPRWH